jgi:hypothetical protein
MYQALRYQRVRHQFPHVCGRGDGQHLLLSSEYGGGTIYIDLTATPPTIAPPIFVFVVGRGSSGGRYNGPRGGQGGRGPYQISSAPPVARVTNSPHAQKSDDALLPSA